MSYVEIEFQLSQRDGEAVAGCLESLGALSVTFKDLGDDPVLEPLPGELRLWPETAVIALFDDSLTENQRLAQLSSGLDQGFLAGAIVRRIEDRVWEREWLKDWKPMRFGERLWICPTESDPPTQPGAVVVWLDPGLAFGTGTHATTAQCLDVLDGLELNGRTIIDYGCGSGVLCIAALKLGAVGAVGVDLDPQALLAIRENAFRNGVAEKIQVQGVSLAGGEPALLPADCVLANILAGPLLELAPLLARACKAGGDLILSGILVAQTPQLLCAYQPWFDIVTNRQREGWTCLHLKRRRTG
jgi:ribosomal protein L11 methyltransferase